MSSRSIRYSLFYKGLFLGSIISLLLIILFGCASNILLLEEAELIGSRAIMAEEIESLNLFSSMSRATRMGLTAEEIAEISAINSRAVVGEIVALDEVAFKSTFERIRLIRYPGKNPHLILKGATEPFAEVLVPEGKIRLLLNNRLYKLGSELYSIEGTSILLRTSPSFSSGRIAASLEEGEIVIKLLEQNGWYQVRSYHLGSEIVGWLPASEVLALFGLSTMISPPDDCALASINVKNSGFLPCKVFISGSMFKELSPNTSFTFRVEAGNFNLNIIEVNSTTINPKNKQYSIHVGCGQLVSIVFP